MDQRQRIDQSIVDLYDEYTHRPLDRRVFLERLITLAGSTAAVQAALFALEPNYARAASVAGNDPRIEPGDFELANAESGQNIEGFESFEDE